MASAPLGSNRLNHSASYTSYHISCSAILLPRDDLNAFQTFIVAVERLGVTELFSAADVEPQVELLGGMHSLNFSQRIFSFHSLR